MFFSSFGCNDSTKLKKNKPQELNKELSKVNTTEYVSDTIKKIIDELKLCEPPDFCYPCQNKNCCYEKDFFEISNIKVDDNSYNNIVVQCPGGSGGGSILMFNKQHGEYHQIQKDLGYVDSILNTSVNGFRDLIIWHRAHKPDGEFALYKWNGKKYEKQKVLSNYKQE
jgi:hypothetical protein